MRDGRRGDDPRDFELHLRGAEVVEQADAAAEQQRREMDLELVEKPGAQVPLSEARSAVIFASGAVVGRQAAGRRLFPK